MTQEDDSEGQPAILKELAELHNRINRHRLYDLKEGKWDQVEILNLLELRKTALEKTIEAVKAGHNRGTIVESLLSHFGLNPFYPPMF
ncbi:MAG: hypothetical protein AAB668_02200 [Patescibacteria group bacterium]